MCRIGHSKQNVLKFFLVHVGPIVSSRGNFMIGKMVKMKDLIVEVDLTLIGHV